MKKVILLIGFIIVALSGIAQEVAEYDDYYIYNSLIFSEKGTKIPHVNGTLFYYDNGVDSTGLYFYDGVRFYKLTPDDSLNKYVYKADSSFLYYTPRQIDSLLLTKTFSPFTIYEDSIEYNKKAIIDTISSSQINTKETYIQDTLYLSNWRYYEKSDTLMTEFYDGSNWVILSKTYK